MVGVVVAGCWRLVGRLRSGAFGVVGRGGGGFSLLPRRVIVAARTARVKAMSGSVLMGLVALTRAVRAAVGRLSGKGEEWSRCLTALRALWAPGFARSGRRRPDPCPSLWCHRWPRRHDVTGGVTKYPLQVRLGVERVPAVAGTGGR